MWQEQGDEKTLVAELGQPVEDLFATFDFTPLAAASIGQAHAATLLDGTQVVVKVRRPGAVEQIEEDLALLHNLAMTASRRWELAHHYDLVGLAQDFAKTLRAELDYIREGENAERFAKNFAHDTTIHIPRIFWKTTTAQVLTLERIYSINMKRYQLSFLYSSSPLFFFSMLIPPSTLFHERG